MSACMAVASSAISTFYRILVYLFLRVLPKSEAKYIIPSVYLLYIATFYSSSPPKQSFEVKREVVALQQDQKPEKNGDAVTTVAVADKATVTPIKQRVHWRSALSTIIFSVPSPVRALRLVNLTINTLLLLAVAEFLAVPYFDDAHNVVYTRVGALYPDAAKIVVRYPATSVPENLVRIAWRQAHEKVTTEFAWHDGPLVNLSAQNDWVQTVRLAGLWPSTMYEYRFEDVNKNLLPYPAEPIRFRTFPDPRLHSGTNFRFISSSCMTPNFPYLPLHSRTINGFDLLADYLWPSEQAVVSLPNDLATGSSDNASVVSTTQTQSSTDSISSENFTLPFINTTSQAATKELAPPTEFMIFMGDFIYADVPVYFGDDKEAYRRLYRRNYNSPSFRKVYERLPIFHTYDDHEIINNYVGQGNSSQEPFPNAADAFHLYNSDANFDSPAEGQYYYDFRHGDAAFFVMDTRRYRSDISTDDPTTHTMLGDKQLAALYTWLDKVNNTVVFKFIVTSVPFTSLWTHDALTDSWAGFPAEKVALLSALHTVPNVILLSGDRHEFAVIEYESGDSGHNVLEISTSPMSMFYVPLVRTLRPKSEEVVNKTREEVVVAEDGSEEIISHKVEVPKEKVVRYIGEGNHKWSSIEVDTRDSSHPVVRLETVIDGKSAYNLEVVGKPIKLQLSTALGALVPQSFKGMLDRIGLKPSKWF